MMLRRAVHLVLDYVHHRVMKHATVVVENVTDSVQQNARIAQCLVQTVVPRIVSVGVKDVADALMNARVV